MTENAAKICIITEVRCNVISLKLLTAIYYTLKRGNISNQFNLKELPTIFGKIALKFC
jgi:hypothetical protein